VVWVLMESWVNLCVWVKEEPESLWIPGTVTRYEKIIPGNDDGKLIIKIDSGREISLPVVSDSMDLKIQRRDEHSDSNFPISDMTSLKFLNEPEMLWCIQRRYSKNLIYTAVGPILIVINPCQQLPIYGTDLALQYYRASLRESRELGPHVYQISDTAYRKMIVDKYDPENRENQVILVNGESGAGMFTLFSIPTSPLTD
jgi:myosin heavy subunit